MAAKKKSTRTTKKIAASREGSSTTRAPDQEAPVKWWKRFRLITVVPIAIGVIGLASALYQAYVLNPAELSIEIRSIHREVPTDAEIKLDSYPDLGIIAEVPDELITLGLEKHREEKGTMTLEALDVVLSRANDELLRRETEKQAELKTAELLSLRPPDSQGWKESEITSLNSKLGNPANEDDISAVQWGTAIDSRESYEAFDGVFRKLHNRLSDRENALKDRIASLKRSLPGARKERLDIEEDIADSNEAYFIIATTLNNSGNSSISIKGPGLLRVYIGAGNYVDLKLTLDEKSAGGQFRADAGEVRAHGSTNVLFRSRQMQQMTDTDRKLIDTFWGQRAHGILFVEDTGSTIHFSNRIAFAEGLSQKRVYDRLAEEASRSTYAE